MCVRHVTKCLHMCHASLLKEILTKACHLWQQWQSIAAVIAQVRLGHILSGNTPVLCRCCIFRMRTQSATTLARCSSHILHARKTVTFYTIMSLKPARLSNRSCVAPGMWHIARVQLCCTTLAVSHSHLTAQRVSGRCRVAWGQTDRALTWCWFCCWGPSSWNKTEASRAATAHTFPQTFWSWTPQRWPATNNILYDSCVFYTYSQDWQNMFWVPDAIRAALTTVPQLLWCLHATACALGFCLTNVKGWSLFSSSVLVSTRPHVLKERETKEKRTPFGIDERTDQGWGMLDFPVDQHSLRALNKCTRVDLLSHLLESLWCWCRLCQLTWCAFLCIRYAQCFVFCKNSHDIGRTSPNWLCGACSAVPTTLASITLWGRWTQDALLLSGSGCKV